MKESGLQTLTIIIKCIIAYSNVLLLLSFSLPYTLMHRPRLDADHEHKVSGYKQFDDQNLISTQIIGCFASLLLGLLLLACNSKQKANEKHSDYNKDSIIGQIETQANFLETVNIRFQNTSHVKTKRTTIFLRNACVPLFLIQAH